MLRLSACTKKSSETLREWGAAQPQGDDLTDILGKVSFLFEQLGKAQAKYAEHLSTFRSYFKDLRTREEGYLALRRARDALQGKIDSADKQNQKTSAEHKEKANVSQPNDRLFIYLSQPFPADSRCLQCGLERAKTVSCVFTVGSDGSESKADHDEVHAHAGTN